jgi:HAMP domain-containing protein
VAVAANSVAYDYTSHSDPTADIESLSQSTDAAQADGAALAALVVGATERSELAQAGQALDVYVALSNQINADFTAGTPSARKSANADVAALAYHTITEPLGLLEQQVAARNESVLTASSAEAARDRVLVVVLMLVALGLAGGVGTVVTRAITSRLRRTMAVLAQVATGDLTKRIDVDSTDEVAQMGAALNLALDRVEEQARGRGSRAASPTRWTWLMANGKSWPLSKDPLHPPFPGPRSSSCWPTTAMPTCTAWPVRHRRENRPGVRSRHPTIVRRPAGPRYSTSTTAKPSMPAPNCAAVRTGHLERYACRSRS